MLVDLREVVGCHPLRVDRGVLGGGAVTRYHGSTVTCQSFPAGQDGDALRIREAARVSSSRNTDNPWVSVE